MFKRLANLCYNSNYLLIHKILEKKAEVLVYWNDHKQEVWPILHNILVQKVPEMAFFTVCHSKRGMIFTPPWPLCSFVSL